MRSPAPGARAIAALGLSVTLTLALTLAATGCSAVRAPAPASAPAAPSVPVAAGEAATAAGTVEIVLVQLNDVYEISPVEGGRSGGLARVATLLDQLRAEGGQVFSLLAGDLLSPSAMGTAKVEGEALDGRQMVAVLNVMGLDFATFGNHEFDLKEGPFRSRLAESRFRWVSSNVGDAAGAPFPGVPERLVVEVASGADGGPAVKLGLFGLTLDSNRKDYVGYRDPLTAAREQVAALEAEADLVVALTHLALADDRELAAAVPGIDLVLGGHEHENHHPWAGAGDRRVPAAAPIFKADANARSVWVHRLSYDLATGELTADSQYRPITAALEDDPETAAEVQKWTDLAFDSFRADGFEPTEVVAEPSVVLDGRESSVRNRSTDLTDLIARAMLAAVPAAELAVYNAGSIRIDDELPPGRVSQYDVLRVLPFGGEVVAAEMTGELLARTLDQGVANRGAGGFLQHAGIGGGEGGWTVGGEPIDPGRTYLVAISDFLVAGRETGLEWLNPDNPELTVGAAHGDVRQAVIAELRRSYPPAALPAADQGVAAGR